MKISLIGPVFPNCSSIAHFTTLLAIRSIDAAHTVQVVLLNKQNPFWYCPGEIDMNYHSGWIKVSAEYPLTPLAPLTWRRTVMEMIAPKSQQVIASCEVTFWGPNLRFFFTRLNLQDIRVMVLFRNAISHETHCLHQVFSSRMCQEAVRYIVMKNKGKRRLMVLLPMVRDVHIALLHIFHTFKPKGLSKSQVRPQANIPTDQKNLSYFGFSGHIRDLQC